MIFMLIVRYVGGCDFDPTAYGVACLQIKFFEFIFVLIY